MNGGATVVRPRRSCICSAVLCAATLFCAAAADAFTVEKRYRSPKNAEREVRAKTELIVLHTTEAPEKSSLRHLSERGLCHYCVTADGKIYAIVDRHRVAFHAGCSMWNGKKEVDNFSIGIECVGSYDKPMEARQLAAIRDLVKWLQRIYGIGDENVLTHSMVAYGESNRWHKRSHRGRKRCGMLFATPSVRRVLELRKRPAQDPDVAAKRLIVADRELQQNLYGGDPFAARYAAVRLPPATSFEASVKRTVAAANRQPQSVAELKAAGYAAIGTISPKAMPQTIAGGRWNSPETYYSIRSRVVPGNLIDPRRVESGMIVWVKRR